jgi:DNA-binding NarL/FixJ family response regulator
LAGSLDGIEAALAIRRESSVPFIFLTGYDDLGYRERAAALEPLGFLIKPRPGTEIRDLIYQYFGGSARLNHS